MCLLDIISGNSDQKAILNLLKNALSDLGVDSS